MQILFEYNREGEKNQVRNIGAKNAKLNFSLSCGNPTFVQIPLSPQQMENMFENEGYRLAFQVEHSDYEDLVKLLNDLGHEETQRTTVYTQKGKIFFSAGSNGKMNVASQNAPFQEGEEVSMAFKTRFLRNEKENGNVTVRIYDRDMVFKMGNLVLFMGTEGSDDYY